MARFGFVGPFDTSISPNCDDQELINMICEQPAGPNPKAQLVGLLAPGKALFCGLPEASVPSMFQSNGRLFAAATNLYEIFADKTFVIRGNLGLSPTGPTQITANQTQLVVMNNGNLFVLALATNAFVAVDMSQFNGPILQIDFADGYIIATLQDSNTFQQSNLEDATTWQGLNISTISLFPDNFVSLKCNLRFPWISSGKKTVVLYNVGAGYPVFIPIQGGFIEQGSRASFATVQLDNSIFWLVQDERGSMIANRANGLAGQRVSTHAVENAWQKYTTTTDAVGYSYQLNGHSVWVIYFPTANATWYYDVATGFWGKLAFWNQNTGKYSADHSMCHSEAFGIHLVGDWATGNIYQLSFEIYTDNGNPIRWLRRSPTISKENKWVYYDEIEFDLDMGLGPIPPLLDGDGQPRDPQLMLRWSNDGGNAWSNTYALNCGQGGDYGARAIKRMLGRARKRVWEGSGTDPIPWRICEAYLQAGQDFQTTERYQSQIAKIT